jgi:hypothetical protein
MGAPAKEGRTRPCFARDRPSFARARPKLAGVPMSLHGYTSGSQGRAGALRKTLRRCVARLDAVHVADRVDESVD